MRSDPRIGACISRQADFARPILGILCGMAACMSLAACEQSRVDSALMPHASSTADCIPAEYGNKTAFCYLSFDEAVSRAKVDDRKQYEIKGVLSLEFGRCVLHRDEFAARHYLDAESLSLEASNCGGVAKSILRERETAVVMVRGRLVPEHGRENRRAGAVVDVVVFEEDIEPARK
jgi:hypothetical protein